MSTEARFSWDFRGLSADLNFGRLRVYQCSLGENGLGLTYLRQCSLCVLHSRKKLGDHGVDVVIGAAFINASPM